MDNSVYLEAINELKKMGAKVKWTSDGGAIRLSRSLYGQWFLVEQNGYHSENERKYLSLEAAPILKSILINFEEKDYELSTSGGRVFLTSRGVFRKSHTQSSFKKIDRPLSGTY